LPFNLNSQFHPQPHHPQPIQKILHPLNQPKPHQTLLPPTPTAKTFTITNLIKHLPKPTLIIPHNNTLPPQLYTQFKQFFPQNTLQYF
uniref:DEAD/DEAH box helicase family protein n=1 Tax=Staphylococcus epidermidis TaxID=1282 RepID=UPI0037DA0E55